MSRYGLVTLLLMLSAAATAAESDRILKTSDGVEIMVRPNTPLQMAAFYEARGFPVAALDELRKACFMTIRVVNFRKDILWLEPNRWEIRDRTGKPVRRLGQAYWMKKWQQHQVSVSSQTAFRWTQLPESRDLHAEEPVGGNITFIPKNGPFSLAMRFFLGPDKTGGEIKVRLSELPCPGRQ